VKIAIDLTMERPLRSDNVIVGSIKKERIQHVPSLFIQPFMTCYRIYEDYMATNKKREPDYLPFSVNRSGKAMTYDAYRKRFEKIVQEMIPIYLNTDDPELVIYGRILMERPISPHIFRHFYTVQLVLSGVSDVGELMSMRGDSSPESALTYLQNKGELEKQYSLVNNHTFDFLKFSAAAQHSEEKKAT
jgi:integrase